MSEIPAAMPRRFVPWWFGLVAFGVLLVFLGLFSVVLETLMSFSEPDAVLEWTASPCGLSIQVLVMSALFAGLAFAAPLLFRVSPKKWLCLKPAKISVFITVASGVLGLGFLTDEALYLLHRASPQLFNPAGLDMFNDIFRAASPAAFAALTLTVTLGPGICEELFFRGLVMRSLLSSAPAWAAVLVSGALFGLIHFDPLQSPGAALIGIYLGFAAFRAKSLYPAVVAHGVNNLICALFARFAAPGSIDPIKEGHPWWILVSAACLFLVSSAAFLRVTRAGDKSR